MLLQEYSHQVGKSCRTVALMNLLRWHGMEIAEDVVFGLCEGFNFSYIKPDTCMGHSIIKVLCPNIYHFENFAKNLSLEYQVITQQDINYDMINNIITYENNPAIVEVSLAQYKDYLGDEGSFLDVFNLDIPISLHISEIIGIDAEYIYTCENFSKKIFSIPVTQFMKARKLDSQTRYNPLHRLYRFQFPQNIHKLDFQKNLKIAIRDNLSYYMQSQIVTVGYSAFLEFIKEYSILDNLFPKEVVEKSLTNSGYLIKYISPGLLRKQYARFLVYCGEILQQEKDFDESVRLLKKADYMWNGLATIMINESIDLEEKLRGCKSKQLISELDQVENEYLNRIGAIVEKWNM